MDMAADGASQQAAPQRLKRPIVSCRGKYMYILHAVIVSPLKIHHMLCHSLSVTLAAHCVKKSCYPRLPSRRLPGTITGTMERMSKQLVLSGRLKPEARLGLEISKFAQSLDDERRREFRRMQTAKGSQISGWDVIKVTEEINQEGARHNRKHKSFTFYCFPPIVFLSIPGCIICSR